MIGSGNNVVQGRRWYLQAFSEYYWQDWTLQMLKQAQLNTEEII